MKQDIHKMHFVETKQNFWLW